MKRGLFRDAEDFKRFHRSPLLADLPGRQQEPVAYGTINPVSSDDEALDLPLGSLDGDLTGPANDPVIQDEFPQACGFAEPFDSLLEPNENLHATGLANKIGFILACGSFFQILEACRTR